MELYDRKGNKYNRTINEVKRLISKPFVLQCVLLDLAEIRAKNKEWQIYEHDFERAQMINRYMLRRTHGVLLIPNVDFHLDSISVMYQWCYKYKKIYTDVRREEAYTKLLEDIDTHQSKALVNMTPIDREFLFNLVYK